MKQKGEGFEKSDRLLSRQTVADRADCCIRTIQRKEEEGVLKPIYLSRRMVRYEESNVQAWIDCSKRVGKDPNKVTDREQQPAKTQTPRISRRP